MVELMHNDRYRLATDPRTQRLTELFAALGEENARVAARGTAVSVLRWAMHNAPGGDLSLYAPDAVAQGIGWHRATNELFDLLTNAGFLDSSRRIVGYDEMAQGYSGFVSWIDAADED